MICARCLRASARLPLTITRSSQQSSAFTRNVQRRQLSVLSSIPTRPNLLAIRSFDGDVPTSAVNTSLSSGTTAIQMRGAKRDTFKPSHRVRKRRHGFLARLRSRTGRMILKRRQAKGRHNLSH